MFKKLFCATWLLLLITTAVSADTLKLKDGSSVDGRVVDQGESYWIKDANGQSHVIAKSDVLSWTKGTAPAAGSATPNSAAAAPAGGSGNFSVTKTKADHAESAIAAVGSWQAFIDSKPSATDLTAAQAELKHWQELVDGHAQKVNGKWIWGDDLKKLIKQVAELIGEGNAALMNNQTLLAISKFEEAVKIYPDNFDANFELGYFNLVKGINTGRNLAKIDAGIKSLEIAVKLQPHSAAALSDLAIGYNFRQKYKLAVLTAYQAAKIEDSKSIVQNLINSISYAPEGMRKNDPQIRPIAEEALILAEKYSIQFGPNVRPEWVWVRPTERALLKESQEEDESKGPPGIFANGSGFFISDDGYILTNRHVARMGDYLMVRQADGTQKVAERILIDKDQDLAIIRIKSDAPVPFVCLAPYDHPPTGADVAVFGFPLLSQFGLGSSVKMTRGIVTAWDKDQEFCDVTVDAQVNPGNSGGPMVDRHGNLLAITAMKTLSNTSVSSYGLGISTGRLQQFLEKQKAKLTGLHLTPGKATGFQLSNEQLATRLTPATVCIFCCRGTPPSSGSLPKEKPEAEAPAP